MAGPLRRVFRRYVRLLVAAVALLGATLAVRAYEVAPEYTEPFRNRGVAPVEGVWLWNTGALVSVRAGIDGSILLTLVESPDPLIETPQVIGHGKFGGSDGTYILELKTAGDLSGMSSTSAKARFIATVGRGGRMSLKPYSTGLRVNAWRLVPYLFRFSVSKDNAPQGIDGAIRVYPVSPSPEFPIVL